MFFYVSAWLIAAIQINPHNGAKSSKEADVDWLELSVY